MGYRNADDLTLAIGHGDLSLNKVIVQISDKEHPEEELLPVAPGSESDSTNAINVVGLQGLLTSIAKCCNPTPGDEIIGYITRGRGATIHRRDCPNILRTRDRERLVQVAWGTHVRTYPVPIRISAYDRRGLIGDITSLFTNESVNMVDANIKVHNGLADMHLIIEVRDIGQLARLLARIENLPNVLSAHRNRPG
jgi:GTP pyrophosphokinase